MHFKNLAALTLCATLTLVASGTVFAHGNEGHDSGATATPLSTPYGTPGSAAKVSRTIALDASDDMRFSKPDIRVRRGETIRFLITNTGQVRHEFSLGTRQELLEHYEMMKKFPDMVHEEANKVTLEPGSKGEVIWTFSKPGVVDFACLHPGHYEAGMKGQIKVASNK